MEILLVFDGWKRILNNENILILDASPGQVYKTKHIAGAISDDIFSYGPKEMPHSEIEDA